MANLQYSLQFELSTKQSSSLILGKLKLLQGQAVINTYMATSSLTGRQYFGSWKVKGGLIPPGIAYQVATVPLWMPDTAGVEGSFYQISPFEIKTAGVTRGDFGIHYDANVPGSLGCVVLKNQAGWDAFRRDLKSIEVQQVESLPMTVKYI